MLSLMVSPPPLSLYLSLSLARSLPPSLPLSLSLYLGGRRLVLILLTFIALMMLLHQ